MTIKIQTQETYIPVQLGDLELKFDVSDESVSIFRKEALEIQKELELVSVSEEYDEALEQTKSVLKKGFDTFFGDGTFEKVYDISPSVVIVMDYFSQITQALEAEIRKMGYNPSAEEKARKYLANKK